MLKKYKVIGFLNLFILALAFPVAGCSGIKTTPTATAIQPTALPTSTKNLPRITAGIMDRTEVPLFETVEMRLTLEAQYTNPYDARQVRLDGVFTGPDGKNMTVPGYWDGEVTWRMSFTPSEVGEWSYKLVATDVRGDSSPFNGTFTVTPSNLHGWLQVGNEVNPDYSSHYLVYKDGTPFYGVGHCDALNILVGGYTPDQGVSLFNDMKKAGENFVVWWPLYSNSPIGTSYEDYSVAGLKIIDMIVADAQKKGIFLIFTIWDHPELRDDTHAWGTGNWNRNGFSKLGDINSFFTSAEAWAWQENFYRYIIARWGSSTAIGMWQTVSEINGTNAYDQTDPWHTKVNNYFVENDPYRHPTTASKSGDIEWPEGHQVMDAPQVHLYDFSNGSLKIDAVHAALTLIRWTELMWNEAGKPNWVGEYGAPGGTYYPELSHNSTWAALASGAAMTPAKWAGGGSWPEMTPEMYADQGRLAKFVVDIPLAKLNPAPLQVSSSDPQVRGWGMAGADGGLFWVQDYSMEGKATIEEVRAGQTLRKGVRVDVQGLAVGTYTITPYDTWQGSYLPAISITCGKGQPCTIALPDFKADMAFKIER